jgi:hypothetical protein
VLSILILMRKERNAYQISAQKIKYLGQMANALIVLSSRTLMNLEKHVQLILVIQLYYNTFKQQENVKNVPTIHIQMKQVRLAKLIPV